MHLAKAPTLTILIPFKDQDGVMRFPHSGGPYIGIHKLIDSAQTLSDQSIQAARIFLSATDFNFTPVIAIDPVLRKEGEVSSVLYLLRPKSGSLNIDPSWPTIAEILRALPQGPTRLAYMKALQHLAGAAEADVSVLEVDDEVRRRLKELESKSNDSLLE